MSNRLIAGLALLASAMGTAATAQETSPAAAGQPELS
jgi:hypothetical protein